MTILNPDGSIRDSYRNFIALSRYARWIEEKGRRETWAESVDRYLTFMTGHLKENFGYEPDRLLVEEIREAIREHQVMPSMRALMTAGPALERENLAAFNCAYAPIMDIRTFAEILYVLMCGTGMGFSVERKYVDELPALPEKFTRGFLAGSNEMLLIDVEDSKEGWADAYLKLLNHLWIDGAVPYYLTGRIRPAGARLKTFGGRASGPGPLIELFDYTIEVLTGAAGRQLTTLEVHDLACKIASVVVVGGVRRSAMISLSDLDDAAMASAKTGEWWVDAPHRSLSNNSAVYEGEITRERFQAEWDIMVASGSGERGIINRDALQKQASKWGRRADWVEYGVNPCSEIIMRPYGLCNLTEVIVRAEDTKYHLIRKTELAAIIGTWQSTLTKFNFVREHWRTNAEEERLLGVSMTGELAHPLLNQVSPESAAFLELLRDGARHTNEYIAKQLGIAPSAAATTVKPSGTVSQLCGVCAGLHPWHSWYICRTVRADAKDPLAALMIDSGFPHELDVMQEGNWVFSFPQKAPADALVRADLTAIEHLELWMHYQQHWTEHKPSVTVSVRPEEWAEVGVWVWEHLADVSGVSFLPYSEHTYKQAPYQEISAEEYEFHVALQPDCRWADLSFYEMADMTTGSQELACSAGGCDL